MIHKSIVRKVEGYMLSLDRPYISSIAKQYVEKHHVRVLENDYICGLLPEMATYVDDNAACQLLLDGELFYCNSENSLEWVYKCLPAGHWLRRAVDIFKNKLVFRETYADIFPAVKFKKMNLHELDELAFEDFGEAFIIKPAVGFLSAGVYRVDDGQDLADVKKIIHTVNARAGNSFSKAVYDSSVFMLESILHGREFAIDAYFNSGGELVIINIFEHLFRDEKDMSDRVYYTSAKMVHEYMAKFSEFLHMINKNLGLKNFPLHAEVRVNDRGDVLPIEINPLRFAGWCMTDVAWHAYRINPYACVNEQLKPDWDKILEEDDGRNHYMSVIASDKIDLINHESEYFSYVDLRKRIEGLHEIRDIDASTNPVAGFMFFSQMPEKRDTVEWLLNTDFSEFIKEKSAEIY